MRTLETMITESVYLDFKAARADPTIDLHHIQITAFNDLPFDDFNHIDEQFEAGRLAAKDYLAHPMPMVVDAAAQPAGPKLKPKKVRGATQFIPPYRR